MLDILSRALRHPIDYSAIRHVTTLRFKERIQENENTYSFIFTAPKLPDWKAGQHAIFTLPGKKVGPNAQARAGKTWRPFSVASAPHELMVRIGTIIPPEPSSFKQGLMSLRPDEPARMYGPYGELYLRPNMKKVVAVAGGIGITPFRSIIADMVSKGNNIDFHLIYSAKAEHVYKSELDDWKAKLPSLRITYTHTPEEVNAELEKEVSGLDDAYFMLSGAPGMIEALRRSLRERRVPHTRIIHDPFKGY